MVSEISIYTCPLPERADDILVEGETIDDMAVLQRDKDLLELLLLVLLLIVEKVIIVHVVVKIVVFAVVVEEIIVGVHVVIVVVVHPQDHSSL